MSKGPGELQRQLLIELRAARGVLSREELRKIFPRQAEDHSLHRSLRSLERMKYVEELEQDGLPCIVLRGPGFWSKGDREALRLAATTVRTLRALAAARGVDPPGLDDLTAKVDAYGQTAK